MYFVPFVATACAPIIMVEKYAEKYTNDAMIMGASGDRSTPRYNQNLFVTERLIHD